MIVLILVHLVVIAIELVIRNDELVGLAVIVIGRHVQDVLARHAGGGNRDMVTIVVVAARNGGHLAATGGLTRSRTRTSRTRA